MKKLLLLALLTCNMSNAQEIHFGRDVYSNVNFILDYGTITEKSFNGILEYDWVSKWGYIKPSVQVLPKINYLDVAVGLGLNVEKGQVDVQWRYYGGIRLGHIWRANGERPLFGLEIGFKKKIVGNLYAGLRFTNDYRQDFELSGADADWQKNGGFELSYSFR